MHDFPSARRGEFPRASAARRGKQRFDDDEPTTAKRVRGHRSLPSIEVFDATDGLQEGDRWSTWDQVDRWSTWDQSENKVPNDVRGSGHACHPACPACLTVRPDRHHGRQHFHPHSAAPGWFRQLRTRDHGLIRTLPRLAHISHSAATGIARIRGPKGNVWVPV